jgi:hypothetical protein
MKVISLFTPNFTFISPKLILILLFVINITIFSSLLVLLNFFGTKIQLKEFYILENFNTLSIIANIYILVV